MIFTVAAVQLPPMLQAVHSMSSISIAFAE
jgi:hypothetical protein